MFPAFTRNRNNDVRAQHGQTRMPMRYAIASVRVVKTGVFFSILESCTSGMPAPLPLSVIAMSCNRYYNSATSIYPPLNTPSLWNLYHGDVALPF